MCSFWCFRCNFLDFLLRFLWFGDFCIFNLFSLFGFVCLWSTLCLIITGDRNLLRWLLFFNDLLLLIFFLNILLLTLTWTILLRTWRFFNYFLSFLFNIILTALVIATFMIAWNVFSRCLILLFCRFSCINFARSLLIFTLVILRLFHGILMLFYFLAHLRWGWFLLLCFAFSIRLWLRFFLFIRLIKIDIHLFLMIYIFCLIGFLVSLCNLVSCAFFLNLIRFFYSLRNFNPLFALLSFYVMGFLRLSIFIVWLNLI